MTDIVLPGPFRVAGTFASTVVIYGRRCVPFLVVTMIASLPGVVVSAAQLGGGNDPGWSGTALAGALLNAAATLLASGAVMYCVVEERRGRAWSPTAAIGFLVRRLPPLIGIALLTAVAMAWGVLVLPLWSRAGAALSAALGPLLPGIAVTAAVDTIGLTLGVVALLVPWCMFCLSMPICIAERAGVFASMSASRRLTRGHRLQVFAALLLFAVGVLVLHGAVAGVLAGVLAGALASTGAVATVLANAALGVIDSSVYGVLAGVLYDDLRVAREGADTRLASVF